MYSSMFYMFMDKFANPVTVTFPQGNIFALFAYMVGKTLLSDKLFSVQYCKGQRCIDKRNNLWYKQHINNQQ